MEMTAGKSFTWLYFLAEKKYLNGIWLKFDVKFSDSMHFLVEMSLTSDVSSTENSVRTQELIDIWPFVICNATAR